MPIIDFGKVAETLRTINDMYNSRDIAPIVDLGNNPTDLYTGNFVEASIEQQLKNARNNEFLWAVHRWDDYQNVVVD
jgi:hypothetical protein